MDAPNDWLERVESLPARPKSVIEERCKCVEAEGMGFACIGWEWWDNCYSLSVGGVGCMAHAHAWGWRCMHGDERKGPSMHL